MKKKTIVYGVGKYYEAKKQLLERDFDVVGYVDKNDNKSKNLYNDISEIQSAYQYIIIMVEKISYIFEILHELNVAGVDANKIIIGIDRYNGFSDIGRVKVTQDGLLSIASDGIEVQVSNEDEYYNVFDTIVMKCYEYNLNKHHCEEVVIDVGMNVGDSAVFFGNKQNVKKVYAFEPFKISYEKAMRNIRLNKMNNKIIAYNVGLSDDNVKRTIRVNDNMSCGLSTDINNNEKAIETYKNWKLIDLSESRNEEIELRKSSEVFKDIISLNDGCELILKMDCEGEEFSIIEDLNAHNLLAEFGFMMIEWHNKKPDMIEKILIENGFSIYSTWKSFNPKLGLLYGWK